jgi:hypothetical protein
MVPDVFAVPAPDEIDTLPPTPALLVLDPAIISTLPAVFAFPDPLLSKMLPP